MIKAHHIHVEGKNRQKAEEMLGDAYNVWVGQNPDAEVVKFFEPYRWDRLFGDHNYNEYHIAMTFFYRIKLPYGLKEL